MKILTWQRPGQLLVVQVLKILIYKYCGIKGVLKSGSNMEEEYNRWNDPGIITVERASEEESRKMREETLQEMMDFFKDFVDESIDEMEKDLK